MLLPTRRTTSIKWLTSLSPFPSPISAHAFSQSIISSAAGVPVSVTGAAVTMTTPTSSFTFSAATSVPVSSPSSAPSDLAVRRISEGASFTFFALVGSMLLI